MLRYIFEIIVLNFCLFVVKSNELTCFSSNVTDKYLVNDLNNLIDMVLILKILNTLR